MATRTVHQEFKVGDVIVYPTTWQQERRYKVLRRSPRRWGYVYDIMDEEIGLVVKRVSLTHCLKVGEDCSRKLVAS